MQAPQIVTEVVAYERRLHPRIAAPERALVAIEDDAVGLPYNMTDISEGGLSFIYIGAGPLSLTDSTLDIYLNEDLQIGRLQVSVIADQKQVGGFIPKRRCSLCFRELTKTQRLQLRNFITRYTPIVQI